MELVQINFKTVTFQFVVGIFTVLYPDPHIECGSGSRRYNEW